MFPTADTQDIPQVTSVNENSSLSRHGPDSPERSQLAKQHNNRELTLNMLIKELVFCIALALTTYGALSNTPTKISKHPQAIRFFGPDSVVTDWYRGQLSNALVAINRADVSFVMYYAPWDAESQYVRWEFERAAMVLSDRVHFSAINCWNPGSECRLQHNKIPSWPILMAYTITSRGVLYKGPRDASSMVNFLELIMKPIERVSSTEDLVNLLSICDAVAVGYTPLTDTTKYYSIWYHVAMKTREFDTIGEICFAAVTSEDLAFDLGVDTVPNARLMLWNNTKDYIIGDKDIHSWNETSLMQWILENFAQPVARIIPMWKKAFSFERYVDGNPLLILFTPMNPLYQQLPSYGLLREVAMEYYNCKNNDTGQWTSELIKLQQVQRYLYQQKDFLKLCQEYKFKRPTRKPSVYYKKEIISQNNKYPCNNMTQRNQKNGVFNFLVKRGLDISKAIDSADDNSGLLSNLGLLDECSTIMATEKSFYDNYEQCQSLGKSFSYEEDLGRDIGDIETTMLPLEGDPLSPENLLQDNTKHFCKLMRFAHEWGPPIFPAGVASSNVTHIHGLACEKNFSLNMIAVDSVLNHHFAESLGIDITNKKDMSALVILDPRHESQYVLSEEYSAKSVRDFIYNFTHNNLKRSLRTHVEDAAHTHYFGSSGDGDRAQADNNTVRVVDLTTHTFKKVVMTPGTVTLVAVCSGGCGALITRALTDAARLLAACGVRARPARLDALRHDLPWHYTVHHLPAVLVFPGHSGGDSESRAYPMGVRVSGGGLAALALRALPAARRLRARIALCARAHATMEKKTCLKDIKEHVTMVIDRNLKYWRRTENRELKDALFKRLQHLHRVSLELSILHISDLNDNSVKQKSLLNSVSTLSNNWDIDISILRKNINSSSSSKTS